MPGALKRSGRTPELREAAKRADRRLKALRDNGDVQLGARVAGEVYAIFDFREPRDGLPSWLDLGIPDDRLVAGVLRLQSDHPGSALLSPPVTSTCRTSSPRSACPSSSCPERYRPGG